MAYSEKNVLLQMIKKKKALELSRGTSEFTSL